MGEKFKTFIDEKTYLPVGFIVVLISCAVSFGVMYQKMDGLKEDVSFLKTETKSTNDKIDKLKDFLLQLKVAMLD